MTLEVVTLLTWDILTIEFAPGMNLKEFSVKPMYMTLAECMTLPEIWPTTIFSVKLMHLCINLQLFPLENCQSL